MAKFNRAKFNAARSRLRSSIRRVEQAHRQLQRSFRSPVVRISCTCGYRSAMRRSINNLPRSCPWCGCPIIYGP